MFKNRLMQYTVKATARATGAAESRLRTWERRYNVPRPARTDSGRRMYNEDDVTAIRRMAAFIESGLPAAEAARAAQSALPMPDIHALTPVADERVASFVSAATAFNEPALAEMVRQVVVELGWSSAL